MELIKNVAEFEQAQVLFIGSVKQGWEHATRLALSSVAYYHSTKDASWIAKVANTFAEADGPYLGCFEKMLYSTTNCKLRLAEDNLDSLITVVHKGNMPEGYLQVLETIQKEGLRRYEKKVKTKNLAATFNRDGAKAPAKVKTSTDADVTSLKTTEVGKSLVSGAEAASKLEGDAAAKAKALADKFNADMAALAAGKDPESSSASDLASMDDPELDALVAKTLATLSALSKLDPELKNRKHKTGKEAAMSALTQVQHDAEKSLQTFQAIAATLEAAKRHAA